MSLIAMNAAITGAQAQEQRIAIIANNIANVSTAGYKRVEANFADLYYSNLKKAGILENAEAAPRPTPVQIGMGTKLIGTYRNLEKGALKQTFHALDIAITGAGYFAVTLPNGKIGYTRAGSFQRDNAGNIVTADGNSLAEVINIPSNIATEDVQISDSGAITGTTPANPGVNIPINQLKIYNFTNESGLEAIGDNLYINTEGSGDAIEVTDTTKLFKQKFVEESNVSSVKELTSLIEAQRDYELNTRVMSTVDKMAEATNNIK